MEGFRLKVPLEVKIDVLVFSSLHVSGVLAVQKHNFKTLFTNLGETGPFYEEIIFWFPL